MGHIIEHPIPSGFIHLGLPLAAFHQKRFSCPGQVQIQILHKLRKGGKSAGADIGGIQRRHIFDALAKKGHVFQSGFAHNRSQECTLSLITFDKSEGNLAVGKGDGKYQTRQAGTTT